MRSFIIPFLLAAAILMQGCSKNAITGSGPIVTEQRTVPYFTGVQAHGDVDVVITYGANIAIEVSGYQNLVPLYDTRVENQTLVLEFNRQYYNIRRNNIKVRITVPLIRSAGVNGSGDIRINDFPFFHTMESRINGSGSIIYNGGLANRMIMDINGSGDIKASLVAVDKAEANIHGSGDIWTSVQSQLKARINGSGDIRYNGSPSVDVSIQGSGRLVKL